MVLDVDRGQVLAYRVAAHGLNRASRCLHDLAVLDLGVQDTPPGSTRLALAARLPSEPEIGGADDSALTLAWSIRGAPHLHRQADLPTLAAALWPLSETDATTRLAGVGPRLKAAGVSGLAAVAATVDALRAVVTGPMTKGEMSAAVTERAPAALSAWCGACQARHIFDSLLRLAALPAGIRIEPGRSPVRFAPIPGWPDPPPDPSATATLVAAYLRLHGPASPAEVAGFLGTTRAEVGPVWPGKLAEVQIDGRRAWLPAARVATLREALPPRLVRLLPPGDPYLQARDREWLLPDKAHRAALWRPIGGPGAVLVDGEIAGVWRAKLGDKARLDVTVGPFRALSPSTRASVGDEADRVAAVRGASAARVRFESP
jgi:hypothetical protein